jgi:Polyketide cyclase / dehydrase and lipid transport
MRNIFRIVLLLVLGLFIFINTRPNTYHVERSTTIGAPAEGIFTRLNDLHQWEQWSPWEKIDPKMTRTYEGAATGVGAGYHWVGNSKVGEGRMTITESRPSDHLGIKLDFIKPFNSTCMVTFTLAPDGDQTRVTWAMDGDNNFMAKFMCIFMNMDKMVGGDFEKGLANLKSLSEAEAQNPAAATPAAAAESVSVGANKPATASTH